MHAQKEQITDRHAHGDGNSSTGTRMQLRASINTSSHAVNFFAQKKHEVFSKRSTIRGAPARTRSRRVNPKQDLTKALRSSLKGCKDVNKILAKFHNARSCADGEGGGGGGRGAYTGCTWGYLCLPPLPRAKLMDWQHLSSVRFYLY